VKLWKTFPRDKYLYWTVTTLVLQVRAANVIADSWTKVKEGGPQTMLAVAEKMMEKHIIENKVPNLESIKVFFKKSQLLQH
jgi:hypothetical protein